MLPWQGHSAAPFFTVDSAHPACVQRAMKPLKTPALGWVIRVPSTMAPDPTGMSAAATIFWPGVGGAAIGALAGLGVQPASGTAAAEIRTVRRDSSDILMTLDQQERPDFGAGGKLETL